MRNILFQFYRAVRVAKEQRFVTYKSRLRTGVYPTKGRGMRLWRYQGANAPGQRPRTLYLSLAL